MVARYYLETGNLSGGSLHIVTDDGNLEDGDIQYCRAYAEEQGDTAGVELADAFLRLSPRQRRKVYAWWWDRTKSAIQRYVAPPYPY